MKVVTSAKMKYLEDLALKKALRKSTLWKKPEAVLL